MVCLVDIDNPRTRYEGRIFWDMLRPGVRLAVLGPQGCCTSVIRGVIEAGTDRYVVTTKNRRYLLTSGRQPSADELDLVRGVGA
jgi:hypothetical protein